MAITIRGDYRARSGTQACRSWLEDDAEAAGRLRSQNAAAGRAVLELASDCDRRNLNLDVTAIPEQCGLRRAEGANRLLIDFETHCRRVKHKERASSGSS